MHLLEANASPPGVFRLLLKILLGPYILKYQCSNTKFGQFKEIFSSLHIAKFH